MKCFDWFRKDPHYAKMFNILKSKSIIIDSTEAARIYFEEEKKDEWTISDFDCLAPVFERVFLDFQHPQKIILENEEMVWGPHMPECWGLDCLWQPATPLSIEHSCKKLPFYEPYKKVMYQWIEGAKWILDVYLYWRIENQLNGPIWFWRLFLDYDGAIIPYKKGTRTMDGPLYDNMINDMATDKGLSTVEVHKILHENLSSFLHTGLMAINLMHCNNVSVIDSPQEPSIVPSKNKQKKGEKIYTPVVFKTLVVTPFKEIIRQKPSIKEQSENKKRYHWVKGCYKTYTEKNKLFGRLTGRFFIPAHYSGSIKKGYVEKDYKISTTQ